MGTIRARFLDCLRTFSGITTPIDSRAASRRERRADHELYSVECLLPTPRTRPSGKESLPPPQSVSLPNDSRRAQPCRPASQIRSPKGSARQAHARPHRRNPRRRARPYHLWPPPLPNPRTPCRRARLRHHRAVRRHHRHRHDQCRDPLAPSTYRVHNLQVGEIFFVIRNDQAFMRHGDGGDDHIKSATWPTGHLAPHHQARPNQTRPVIERQNATSKQRLWSLWPGEPRIERGTFPAMRLLPNAAADFCQGERGDEQILVTLRRHPDEQRLRRLWFDSVADNVGVEKIPRHRSTLRPASRGRVRSRSAPASGERRNAARMPPCLPDSPGTACCTVRRICPTSGPASTSLRASARSRSRSASKACSSNRTMPRPVSPDR